MKKATLSVLALVLLLQVGVALADIPPPPPARPDKEGFSPVTDKDLERARVDETVSGPNLIAAAYGFILAAVMIYAYTIGRRAHRVEGELNNLHARIVKKLDESTRHGRT